MSAFMNMHVNPPPIKVPEIKHMDMSEAIVYFQKMFPNLDNEVIESILRANYGCVDESVDQLLVLSVDADKEKSRTGRPSGASCSKIDTKGASSSTTAL